MSPLRLLMLSCLVISLLVAQPAHALPQVKVIAAAEGVWIVQGADLTDVLGMDILVTCNPSGDPVPSVVKGDLLGGATMIVNPAYAPGAVRIAVITTSAISGSGTIATLTLGKSASITAIRASFISGTDAATQVQGIVETAGGRDSAASAGKRPTQSEGLPVDGAEKPATPSAPEKEQARGDLRPNAGASSAGGGAVVPGAASEKTGAPALQSGGDIVNTAVLETAVPVLDRIMAFKGTPNLEALIALFTVHASGWRQEPDVVLSDGAAAVTVYVSLPLRGLLPNFALIGATLVSLKASEDGWVLEALPDKGGYSASVLVSTADGVVTLPLTVAPPALIRLLGNADLSVADYRRFQEEKGTDGAPLHDLNGDGKRDAIDDFIFAANYIVEKRADKSAASDSTRMSAQ